LKNFSTQFLKMDNVESEECPVCYDDFPGKDLFSMNCKHFMCTLCWAKYLHGLLVFFFKVSSCN
jgi:hypothetical protein